MANTPNIIFMGSTEEHKNRKRVFDFGKETMVVGTMLAPTSLLRFQGQLCQECQTKTNIQINLYTDGHFEYVCPKCKALTRGETK